MMAGLKGLDSLPLRCAAIVLKELPLRTKNPADRVKQFSLLSSQCKSLGLRGLKASSGSY